MVKEERWIDIKGYEGLYKISNKGRVLICNQNKIKKASVNAHGYLKMNLSNKGIKRSYTVHRLVMENFNPVYNMKELQVNHINENKKDNSVDNLEWCDAKYNCNYGSHNKKLKYYRSNNGGNRKTKVICLTTGIKFNSISEACKFYNIRAKSQLTRALNDKNRYCGKLSDGTVLKWSKY